MGVIGIPRKDGGGTYRRSQAVTGEGERRFRAAGSVINKPPKVQKEPGFAESRANAGHRPGHKGGLPAKTVKARLGVGRGQGGWTSWVPS